MLCITVIDHEEDIDDLHHLAVARHLAVAQLEPNLQRLDGCASDEGDACDLAQLEGAPPTISQ